MIEVFLMDKILPSYEESLNIEIFLFVFRSCKNLKIQNICPVRELSTCLTIDSLTSVISPDGQDISMEYRVDGLINW